MSSGKTLRQHRNGRRRLARRGQYTHNGEGKRPAPKHAHDDGLVRYDKHGKPIAVLDGDPGHDQN